MNDDDVAEVSLEDGASPYAVLLLSLAPVSAASAKELATVTKTDASGAAPATEGSHQRVQMYGVVVVTGSRPLRCKMGRENSVESLCKKRTPRFSADLARAAVSAR